MKRLLTILCCLTAAILLLPGCATSGGKTDAGLKAEFAPASGKATIERELDPATGKLVKETTTLENVASFEDRDRAKVAARGLFTIQTVEQFAHERNGRTGGSSKTGVKTYQADPDEKAIESGGTAAGNVAEKIVQGVKGKP